MANCPIPTNDSITLELLGEHVIRRSVVRISKVQGELLDKKEAWAHEQCNRQQWFNVPPDVLRDLKAFYSQKLKAEKSKKVSVLQPQQADVGPCNKNGDLSGSVPTTPRKGGTAAGDGDDQNNADDVDGEVEEDEERPTPSWSKSPEHHYRARNATRVQELEEEESDGEEAEQEDVEHEESLPQLPPRSPSPQPNPPAFKDVLPSSPGPENELELEIPAALDVHMAPINKAAQQAVQPMLATPPSAQIVPCTLEQQDLCSTDKDKIRQAKKRPVYKKVPQLYRPPKSVAPPSFGLGMTRLGSSKPTFNNTQSSTTTTTTSSSSIIPSTHCKAPITMGIDDRSRERRSESPESSNLSGPQPAERPEANTGSLEPPKSPELRQASPEYIPPSPRHVSSSPPPRATTQAPIANPEPFVQPIQPEAPFIEYTLRYPDYKGSIGDFVTACVYLQTLVGKRRLRPFLFDDFIRAWSEGYLPYVRECDESEPPTKALTAIEWFNQIDDPPTCTQQVVTRPDLERILDFYPEDALAARGILRVSQKSTPEEAESKGKRTTKASLPAEAGSQSSLKSSAPQIDRASQGGASTVAEILEEKSPEASIPATSPVAHRAPPPSPPPPPPAISPPAKSMGALQKWPPEPAATGLTRSLSATAPHSHKRKPSDNNEFQLPAPKKKVVPTTASFASSSRPASSSGGSVRSDGSRATAFSAAPSSSITGGRRRYGEDPEKRKRKFAKFLKKQKQKQQQQQQQQQQKKNDDDIVTSSAPVGNNSSRSKTPTSGQWQGQR